jgi:hypothetical protein
MVVQPLPNKEKLEAPYASPGHVLGILTRYRERSLPPVLSVEAIEDMGSVSKVYAYRTLDALQFLGFLDDKNHPQPVFHRLRELTDDEYKTTLAEQLRLAYPRLFENLDPAKDDEQQIRDHFRRYDPPSQTARQFQLFRALSVAAGLIEGRSRTPAKTKTRQNGSPGPGRRQSITASNRKEAPPILPPPSDDDVRRLLAEALIEKIREVDASDWETMEKYLGKIKELSTPAKQDA